MGVLVPPLSGCRGSRGAADHLGRGQTSGGNLESGVTDDSSVNPLVSKALRHFLPGFFPGKFDQFEAVDWDPWEMEWVRCRLVSTGLFVC